MSYRIDGETPYWGGLSIPCKEREYPDAWDWVFKEMTRTLEESRKACKEWDEVANKLRNKLEQMEEKKTKKMTRAEAFEWLSNKKIDASINEREVQLKLFSLGVVWCTLDSKPTLGVSYLLIDKECHMTHCGGDWDYYKTHRYEEISADDILSIEIIDENKTEEEKALDKISYLGAQIVDILWHMKGHHHVAITENDVILYDEGMSLFHSDPF